jgi:hypothetical protein
VTCGDPARNLLKVELIAGEEAEFRYDQLVVALGSVSRTVPIPGLAEHAIGFKTIAEAIVLCNCVVRCLEIAEEIDDPELRRQYLSFVFVGGGYAGVEGLAELQDFSQDALEYYPRCRLAGVRWVLVEAAERIMPEIQPQLAEFTQRLLRKRGIEIMLQTQVESVSDTSVTVSTGETIPARTLCWTAGVKASPVAAELGLPRRDQAVSVQDTRLVRRSRAPQRRRQPDGHSPQGSAGVGRVPLLPPRLDARTAKYDPFGHRLDGRLLVPARHVRDGPARASEPARASRRVGHALISARRANPRAANPVHAAQVTGGRIAHPSLMLRSGF